MIESDERYTPREVWEPLNRLFDFSLDPCTSPENPLACNRFFTAADDGLAQVWKGEKAFVNPPYSMMLAWAEKAAWSADSKTFIAFILPNDSTTKAYKVLEKAAWGDWKPPKRVKFLTPDGRRVDVARSHIVFLLGGLER